MSGVTIGDEFAFTPIDGPENFHRRVQVRAGVPGQRALCGELTFRRQEWDRLSAHLYRTDLDRAVLDAAEVVADACDEDKTHEDYYHLHPCCNDTTDETEYFRSVLDALEDAVRARREAQS